MASQEPSDTAEIVDVLVIGAGPSGAVVTHTAAAAGLSVVCLEQGDWVNPSDFPANFPEWELLIQHNWAHDPNVRGLPSDYPVDVEDSDMWPVMFNAVGGSSIYYGAEWPRLLPSDFRVKTLDGVADDWPISYNDLKPYHDEVDEFIGVAGVGGDTAYPEGLDYPAAAAPAGQGRHQGRRGRQQARLALVARHQCDRQPEVQDAGAVRPLGCVRMGLPAGRQGLLRPDLHAPSAQGRRAGASPVRGSARSSPTSGGLATGAEYIDRDGKVVFQPARAVVLCANGVGTPRLLAAVRRATSIPTAWPTHRAWSAATSCCTPTARALGYYEEDLESWRGPAGQLIHSMQFYETDKSRGFVRGAKMHALPTPGPLNAIEAHRELRLRRTVGPGDPRRGALGAQRHPVGRQHRGPARGTQPRHPVDRNWSTPTGCPPRRSNTGSATTPARLLKFTVERMVEAHEAAGATHVITTRAVDRSARVICSGTARMGDDPATSVVDSYGKAHDVDNLYIADGSIFVTSGSANPTCTISALALRVGKKVVEQVTARKAQS